VSARNWALVAAMVAAVYLPKGLPLLLVTDRLPPGWRRWLQYMAPAVLSALVAPAVLAPHGRLAISDWQQAAYLAAFVVAVLSRRMLLALAAGVAVLLLVTALGH